MIDLYFANIGSGKTTLLAKIAKQELKKIKDGKSAYKYVVSNALIKGVRYVPDIRKILKKEALSECLVLIDEASIVYNNRAMKITEKEIQYFKLSRHYKTDIIVVSQSYEDIDITLRRLYNKIYLLNKLSIPHVTSIKEIIKTIDIDVDTYQIVERYEFLPFFFTKFLFRWKYYNMFNTHWVPDDIPVANVEEFELLPALEEYTIKQKIVRQYNKTKAFIKLKKDAIKYFNNKEEN